MNKKFYCYFKTKEGKSIVNFNFLFEGRNVEEVRKEVTKILSNRYSDCSNLHIYEALICEACGDTYPSNFGSGMMCQDCIDFEESMYPELDELLDEDSRLQRLKKDKYFIN